MAQAVDPLAAKFGAIESIVNVSISPDGKRVAVLAPRPQGGEAILVVALDGGNTVAIPGSNGQSDRLRSCGFATDTRIVCNATYTQRRGRYLDVFSRLLAVDSTGTNMKVLTPGARSNSFYEVRSGGSLIDLVSPDGGNAILVSKVTAEEFTTGSYTSRNRPGTSVISIDTLSGKFKEIEPPKRTATEYISDGKGNVRVMGITRVEESGQLAGRNTYQYRKAGSRDWLPLSTVEFDSQTSRGFVPQAVDSDIDAVYGFADHNGFKALYRRSLARDDAPELVLARNDVDVDGLVRIGRQERVVGASYATEKRMVEFFDPELRKLAVSLGQALPKGSQISFVDATSDEGKLVLFVSSDTNPGVFYLFDKATKRLSEIAPVRPELAGLKLSTVKPITFPAADGTMIPGYLTLPPGSDGKNLPAIVMPHGGPSARDEWGFDWLSQYYASKGYAVLQPNFRGSAGYGSAWFQKNGFRSWKLAVGDVNDAGRWLVREGIAASGKLGIVGWSYGGYAALQSQVLDPDLFKAVVAIAPVTDLDEYRNEFNETSMANMVQAFVGQGPYIAEGSPARRANLFKSPVLLFHGDVDQNVAAAESRLMADRLKAAGKSVEYVEFKGLDHYLDNTAARTRMLSESAAFLSRNLGGGTAP
ncbi:dipeptidyl aminopeptidase/acylaminoacyl peptidase [Novosphingobium hassiacum]|uniref:Dipeptidyl aminopeptidase/acylaminoacyl peptidase n=1 Tax=Novosphingobium hassiacum TaxID=173676 RepID=A0A7W5ZWL3_9SPHN|nr:S9 family peptidase [Novosphingobium hassiacum]MBB3860458.1 dipeptidyl aminopeptidase/acylaminoacyl peptidase [Novosphingobium hassiacum]